MVNHRVSPPFWGFFFWGGSLFPSASDSCKSEKDLGGGDHETTKKVSFFTTNRKNIMDIMVGKQVTILRY